MGMKKIIRQIEEYVDEKISESYSEGYRDGMEDALTDRDIGFADGIRGERDRIIKMFKFLSQQELEAGSGNKAKMYHDVAELVNIANMSFEDGDEDDDV